MKLRIAQLSSNVERVPPRGYGGTEIVVSMLTEELVRRGHQVTLFATGDSETKAGLVSVADQGLRDAGEAARRWHAYDIRLLMELQKRRAEFDVVHNHMGWQALPYLEAMDCPVVTTNHNPIKDYAAPIYMTYAHLPYVAISEAYRRMNYPDELNYIATIYNGIDLQLFDRGDVAREFLLFIGRLCEDKGTAHAIEIAKRLKLPIVLAGKVDDADRGYFEEQVRPHLNPPAVEFVGEVGHGEKIELYRKAIATVYPINFEEPFGLVMAESLAAGTPVMALDRGSVREVLSDGDTAVIARDVDELVQRFGQIQSITPQQCRQRVRDLFSKERMVDRYEEVYRQVIAERRY